MPKTERLVMGRLPKIVLPISVIQPAEITRNLVIRPPKSLGGQSLLIREDCLINLGGVPSFGAQNSLNILTTPCAQYTAPGYGNIHNFHRDIPGCIALQWIGSRSEEVDSHSCKPQDSQVDGDRIRYCLA